MRKTVAFVLMFFAGTALAAPRIESVAVKSIEGSKSTEVLISVTIERPTPLDMTCTAVVDPGDGGRQPQIAWAFTDSRTKTTRYEYKKPGTYRMKVSGGGEDACAGTREVTVKVGSAASAAPSRASAAASDKAPRCPSGWVLVEDSVKGARYTCRAKLPAQGLKCAGGTHYFADRGEIGCR